MKINEKKTKIALFNSHKKYDFSPELNFSEGTDSIEVVEEYKLLGQIIRTDLKLSQILSTYARKHFKECGFSGG